jgi:periplasmic divalent cation tolerance protein
MDKPLTPTPTACALVITTLASREAALAVARTLVEERLAACVQLIDGLRSIYRWQGRVEESSECQLVAKAPPERVPALVERLRALHPYELPEIVVLEAQASDAYAAWIRAEAAAVG